MASPHRTYLPAVLLVLFISLSVGLVATWIYARSVLNERSAATPVVTTFDECAAAGYAILESYPARCLGPNGTSYTQDIGNELELVDLIVIDAPRPTAVITSPLTITGRARGSWYFEGTFPVRIEDALGATIAAGVARADGEWTTDDFVDFSASLTYARPSAATGTLILERDNPSGIAGNDQALRVPVVFGS